MQWAELLKPAGQEIHLGEVNLLLMTTGRRWKVQDGYAFRGKVNSPI